MLKDKVYNKNSSTENDLKKIIQVVVSSIPPAELCLAKNKVPVRDDAYLQAEINHFQHLLYAQQVKT
jgi:hypothetical protein